MPTISSLTSLSTKRFTSGQFSFTQIIIAPPPKNGSTYVSYPEVGILGLSKYLGIILFFPPAHIYRGFIAFLMNLVSSSCRQVYFLRTNEQTILLHDRVLLFPKANPNRIPF